MSIRNAALSTAFLLSLLTTFACQAQQGKEGVIRIPDPQRLLLSPAAPDSNYPLQVWLRFGGNGQSYWNPFYNYYSGIGRFTLDTSAKTVYHFNYECDASFRDPGHHQYQARWIQPGKKLQILLVDDSSEKKHTCNLATFDPTSTKGFRRYPTIDNLGTWTP